MNFCTDEIRSMDCLSLDVESGFRETHTKYWAQILTEHEFLELFELLDRFWNLLKFVVTNVESLQMRQKSDFRWKTC